MCRGRQGAEDSPPPGVLGMVLIATVVISADGKISCKTDSPRPRPTPTYDDDIQEVQPVVKQEPVSAEPAVEPQHPYSQEVQGGQELAHMEEGGNYEEENYDYGGYEDEENYAMAETGGEQNKGRTPHSCEVCPRRGKTAQLLVQDHL